VGGTICLRRDAQERDSVSLRYTVVSVHLLRTVVGAYVSCSVRHVVRLYAALRYSGL
jgi:CRP-like cAMP-binding protein